MGQAQSTDRRWSRALQHEHSIRLQLQENMEKLAREMHGLETEARKASLSAPSTPGPLGVNGGEAEKQGFSPTREAPVGGAVRDDGGMEEEEQDGAEESDEDDKFFDAEDETEDEWLNEKKVSFAVIGAGVQREGLGASEGKGGGKEGEGRAGEEERREPEERFGHKRNISTASMNEAQRLLSPQEPEQLPVYPEMTMSVSHHRHARAHSHTHICTHARTHTPFNALYWGHTLQCSLLGTHLTMLSTGDTPYNALYWGHTLQCSLLETTHLFLISLHIHLSFLTLPSLLPLSLLCSLSFHLSLSFVLSLPLSLSLSLSPALSLSCSLSPSPLHLSVPPPASSRTGSLFF